MSIEHTRLSCALLLSLLLHALLLSLMFGGQGLGLPGFGFPWQVRRIEAPDLRVVVVPTQAQSVAEPLQSTWIGQPVAAEPPLAPTVPRAPTPRQTVAAIVSEVNPRTDTAASRAPVQVPLRADRPSDTAPPPTPATPVIALTPPDESTWTVPVNPAPAVPVNAAPSASSMETAMPSLRDSGDKARVPIEQDLQEATVDLAKPDPSRQEKQRQADQLEAARQDTARREAAPNENAGLEADRQEAARQALLLESTQQAAARQQAALREAARIEAARVETARVETARVETARVEAARVEAARVEAARAEAARAEAARVEAARAEAGRAETARIESARIDAAQEAAARREATLRAIGKQLDEEAARRDAAARQTPSSGGRRYRLFGRTDPNSEIILYAEAWSRKIQLNMTFEMVREAAKQPHTDPVVTVAVRSDGSVESVTFVVSSGVAALDEAIRRVVRSQTPYQVFPPELAREFDVIEIRRTWYFDLAIRLY